MAFPPYLRDLKPVNRGRNQELITSATSLLPDKSIRGPHSLRIAIRCVHELHIMSLHPQYAKPRIFWCGQTFEALEVLLHFLAFASLRVLIGRIEFIL
jgi:hypothetical protein